jgi:hypothetical protein
MKARMKQMLVTAVLATAALPAWGDVIELRDGRKIYGTMSRQGNQIVIKGDDGKTTMAAQADVLHVTLTAPTRPASPAGPAPAADIAKSDWTRAAADIKKADNLQTVIDLHEKFLEKHPDSPMAQDVKKSLDVYQTLANANARKLYGQWMTEEQIDSTLKAWTEAARPARSAYREGRMKDALESARVLLAKDDRNPEALIVAGMAAYRTNVLPLAQRCFTTLAESEAPRAAALLAQNNLAVIAWQQKQPTEGLQRYLKALQLDSSNRSLLDNITAAINAYTRNGGDKKAPGFRTLNEQYLRAEARMEGEMANRGLYRYGSQWVTKDDQERLKENAAAIHGRMEALDAQFKATRDQLVILDTQAKQANAELASANSALAIADSQLIQLSQSRTTGGQQAAQPGNLQLRRNLAAQDVQRANQKLSVVMSKRAQLQSAAPDFFGEADKLKAQLAAAEAASVGEQHIMDLGDVAPEPPVSPAAPVSDTAAPATAPAAILLPSPAGLEDATPP